LENSHTSGVAQQNASMTEAEMRNIGRSFTTFDK
jgi:hypothetical protein